MRRHNIIFLVLFVLLLIVIVVDLQIGAIEVSLFDILNAPNEFKQTVFYNIRVTRIITALCVGAGLSVCGLILQTVFKNPLAGPFVLGISSGASLGVAIVTLGLGAGMAISGGLRSFTIVGAAAIGAILTLMIVLGFAKRVPGKVTVLIIGLMVAHLAGAFEGLLQYLSNPEAIQLFVLWGLGSFSGVVWNDLAVLLPVTITGSILIYIYSKALNALLLGDDYANSMGVNIKALRQGLILITGLVAGTITAYCGPIAFIGIAVPHLTRNLFRHANHKKLIPGTILTGMLIAVGCDALTHIPGNGILLPINTVTSVVGAPVLIWFIWKNSKQLN